MVFIPTGISERKWKNSTLNRLNVLFLLYYRYLKQNPDNNEVHFHESGSV